MGKSIQELSDQLATNNLTIAALESINFITNNAWQNVAGFENTIKAITGKSDVDSIQKIGRKAIALYNDTAEGYQIALWLYQVVDHTDKALSTFSFGSRFNEKIPLSNFFNELALKSEEAQSLDLCLKLTAELTALCYLNGISDKQIAYFGQSLPAYKNDSLMRMAGLVCFDGLLPLGANFTDKVLSRMNQITPHELRDNLTFQKIRELIPGASDDAKLKFIREVFSSAKDWMDELVKEHDLSPQAIGKRLHGLVDFTDDKLDCLGAFLDAVLNYYEHTGTQTVTRRLIERAATEV
ncbi:MAG: hypothetical protein WCO45_13685 [Pseudanabaena sp. ELA607]|jgi:hypothetical protein